MSFRHDYIISSFTATLLRSHSRLQYGDHYQLPTMCKSCISQNQMTKIEAHCDLIDSQCIGRITVRYTTAVDDSKELQLQLQKHKHKKLRSQAVQHPPSFMNAGIASRTCRITSAELVTAIGFRLKRKLNILPEFYSCRHFQPTARFSVFASRRPSQILNGDFSSWHSDTCTGSHSAQRRTGGFRHRPRPTADCRPETDPV
jgi:hypothetical protein